MSDEVSLKFARKMCEENRFITVLEHGKTYVYRNGYYKPIKSAKNAGMLHELIINTPEGNRFAPSGRDKIIRNIEALTIVSERKINPDGIFNFQDCLYDTNTNTNANHSPDFYFTVQLPYELRTKIDCPQWIDFLGKVMEGNLNKVAILQEFVGYCLIKSCNLEKSLFIIGQGSNGKSTFTETISALFGRQNVSSVSLQNLSNPVLRCEIIDKYINIDSDLPRNAADFEEAFRKITSGESIQFNAKFLPPVSIPTNCKLIYSLNDFPLIKDTSNAFYRRMLLIPFDLDVAEEDQDHGLKSRLLGELAGIFRWAVQGRNRLLKQGKFSANLDMIKMIHELKIDNNPILSFADEFLQFESPSTSIVKNDMYALYKNWTTANGNKPFSFRKFNSLFFSSFKKLTKNDFLTGTDTDRKRAWPNISYKIRENAFENGERVDVLF